ncbi:uncharacterized protein EDB93DRAFT_181398 [Suillus bovinus]|uniref:uncharacterized protein n=1 Tax=Suillus bovinus TaxID=48563 RepID=UPI001B87CD73|nr:uncharacterized protein EDB93DRAFT_181398 [Suillus bovinus]KAG2127925.1 hypothetical protein EDB93DRAFT_181398 [Suillus bovinus]
MRNIVLHLFFFLGPLLFAPVLAKYRNVTVDNTDPSIQYVGDWNQCSLNIGASYDGTRNCTGQQDATATFTFTGVAIYYISPLIGNRTTVLTLDSGPSVLVNLTQAQGQNPNWAIRWGASGLDNGPHTLVNYGSSNTTSSAVGEVDAFIYTVVEQDHNLAAIVGGAVAGAAALASVGACCIFGQSLADWLRQLVCFSPICHK